MKRIFTAVDISEEARRQAAVYIENLRREFPRLRIGWDKPEKLHLTLKFLGETSEGQLDELKRACEEIAAHFAGFNLQIAETGVFPNARNPRVLWIDVKDGQGNLAKINEMLETECEKMGFPREKRRFVPHLTIGRIREPHEARELARKHLANKIEPVEYAVSQLVIYESKLQPTGSIYTKLKTFQFKERD